MSGPTAVMNPDLPPTFTPTTAAMCTQCGSNMPSLDQATQRIRELESQIRLLNAKAAAAVDKLADYEDEVTSLRSANVRLQTESQNSLSKTSQTSQASLPSQQQTQTPPPPLAPPLLQPDQNLNSPSSASVTASPPRQISRLASLSSFLPGRRRDTAIIQPPPNTPLFPQQERSQSTPVHSTLPQNPSDSFPSLDPSVTIESRVPPTTLLSLQTSLEAERNLRIRAESNLTQTQSELEELTATLFGQANEMVAEERKARAKLEERVKVLEDRDGEKRRRLERLEKALERIDRVRGLVREVENDKMKTNITVVEIGATEDGQDVRNGALRVIN